MVAVEILSVTRIEAGVPKESPGARVFREVDETLAAVVARNQCSFMPNTAELVAGCDAKLSIVARAVVAARKRLDRSGSKAARLKVSGYTQTTGNPDADRTLSAGRAEIILRELLARGVPAFGIYAEGKKDVRSFAEPAPGQCYDVRPVFWIH
jgi:OmpA-OmpF porin, OOP family